MTKSTHIKSKLKTQSVSSWGTQMYIYVYFNSAITDCDGLVQGRGINNQQRNSLHLLVYHHTMVLLPNRNIFKQYRSTEVVEVETKV